ncbi:MAG: hypothetical protein J7M40_03045 [Planctomycetes bacterium]|nr:hypothetical protein [Planctomycetota bacterium]
MDRNRHFAQTVLLTLHLALLCLVLCLSGGCEEAIVNGPPVAAGPEPVIAAVADLEVVAEAVGNALDETAYPGPEVAGEDFEAETDDAEVEMAVEADPVAIAVEGIVKADDAGVVQEIFAESAQPMAEDCSEKEATAELAERIGLGYPIPAMSLGLGADEPDPAADLDKMHIADVLLLAEDTKPAQGYEEIQPSTASGTDEAGSEAPAEEAKPKGFAAKFILTPCGAVAGFARRHGFLTGAAIVFVAGLIVVKKRKLSFSNPWRRWNSGR